MVALFLEILREELEPGGGKGLEKIKGEIFFQHDGATAMARQPPCRSTVGAPLEFRLRSEKKGEGERSREKMFLEREGKRKSEDFVKGVGIYTPP